MDTSRISTQHLHLMSLTEQVSYFYLMTEAERTSGTPYFFNQKQDKGQCTVYLMLLWGTKFHEIDKWCIPDRLRPLCLGTWCMHRSLQARRTCHTWAGHQPHPWIHLGWQDCRNHSESGPHIAWCLDCCCNNHMHCSHGVSASPLHLRSFQR